MSDNDCEDNIINKKPFDICEYLNEYYMRLNENENNVINRYLEEEGRSEIIYHKMTKCLNTLDKFESILVDLKKNLNDLGRNVFNIGEETENINNSIENRIEIRGHIRKYIDDLMISPIMIDAITNNSVNDQIFVEQLHDLKHKIITLQSYENVATETVENSQQIISQLKNTANEKIKLYLLKRINHCRKQTTNYAIIQSTLLSHNFLYQFLQMNDTIAANEILQCYTDIMQNLYYELMKSYIKNLTKLLDTTNIPNINQLLGSNVSSSNSRRNSSSSLKPNISETLYSIGDRGRILNEELFMDSIISHMITTKQKLSTEVIFRSLLYALLSNCFNEFDFIHDFFKLNDNNPFENCFDSIFGRCFQYFLSTMDKFFAQTLDYVGVVLCIGLTSRYYVVTNSKNLKICTKYLSSILNMLWFRFNEIVNLNISSLSSPTTVNDSFVIINLLPHFITCKCSNAIITLISIKGDSPFKKIENIVSIIFKEWREFIEKASNEFQIKVDRLIFMGNNLYYMIESIQNTIPIPFPDGFHLTGDNINHWSNYKHTLVDNISTDVDIIINDTIEIDIDKQFTFCIGAIRDLRKNNSPNDSNFQKYNTEEVIVIVTKFLKEFDSNWKNYLKNTLNRYKVLFFSLNLNSRLIQRYLNRFIQSYNIITDFIQGATYNNPDHISDLKYIDIQVIMVEIKKYTDLIP